MQPDNTDTISRLDLERWALGTLDPARAQQLEAARASDPALDQRMQRIQGEIQSAAAGMPQLVLPPDEATESERGGFLAWLLRPWSLAAVGALAAAVALFAVLGPLGTAKPADGDKYRGMMPELDVYRVRDGEAVEQGVLIQAREGDRIQYEVMATGAGHLSIYNLQDDGQLQQYLAPRPIGAGEAYTAAISLDAYAGTERIFFLIGEEPIDETTVSGAVQRAYRQPLAELDALPDLPAAQRSVLVVKE